MKLRYALLLAICCSFSRLQAQDSGFGLGLMLGEPTGLSGKLWTGGDRALAFGLAWGLGGGGYLHAHADYLFHNSSLFNVNSGKLMLHYGPGIRLRSWSGGRYWNRGRYYYYNDRASHVRLGIRIPVGLTYAIEGAPLDVFLEVAPALDLLPGTSADFDGAIGIRFYFK